MSNKDETQLKIVRDKLVAITNGKMKTIGEAIHIHKYISNVDTDEVTVQFSFIDNGKKIIKSLKRDKVTTHGIVELTKYGADCWAETAKEYTTYFREQISKTKRSYQHSKVGWGTYNDTEFFKLYQGIGFDSQYDGIKYNIKPEGTLDAWLTVVKEEVVGKPWLEFALAAGLTAPLLKIIGDKANMDSLFINFYGMSTTGKTLATRLAVSPFGFPDKKGNGLLQLWYGTDQGILSSLKGNFGVPLAIDDTSTQEDDKDFTQFIYLIAAGKDKAALNSDGSNREQEEWITTVFSSSETSILQKTDERSGIRVRFFEINEPKLTDTAENAERIEQVITKNYGHAGIEYVSLIVKLGHEEIYKRWQQQREDLIKIMENDPFSKRIAGKLAIVALAGQLANESLGIGLDIKMLTQSLLTIENKSLKTRDLGERAYIHIIEYFSSNINKFFKDKDDSKYKNKGEILGKYIQKDGIIKEIRIPADKFKRIMEKAKFDINQVTTLWKEKDLLICDKGKNTLSRVFQSGMPKMAQYCIKVRDSALVYNKLLDKDESIEAEKDLATQNKIAKKEQEKKEAFNEYCEIEQDNALRPLGRIKNLEKKKGKSNKQQTSEDDWDLDDET